jgi:ketosteroid isomerase-like protein
MAADMERLRRLADHVFQTWNTQDVEAVLACYTSDLAYLDPNTRGPVKGRDAMRAYLTKLYDQWTMTWEGREFFPLRGVDGVTVRWSGTLAPAGTRQRVDIAGLDLVVLDGDLVQRNEVYFDRTPLLSLSTAASTGKERR